MAVNTAALKAPGGLLKIVELVLTIIVLIIARTAFSGTGETMYQSVDHRWLTIITFGGYTIILSAIILTWVMGEAIANKTEMLFINVGASLFIIVGAMLLSDYSDRATGSTKTWGFILGILSIINGIVMIVDSLILGNILKLCKGQ